MLKKNIWNSLRKIRAGLYRIFLLELYAYRIVGPLLKRKLAHREDPIKYLFIISPMRSGSTLLAHVLNGHPRIAGYGESHVPYLTERDLSHLIARTRIMEPSFSGSENFILEKMVWNYEISDKVLASADIYFVFLVREPAATFRSMGKLADQMPESPWARKWLSHDECLAYYQNRLNFMSRLMERINNSDRCLLLDFSALVNDTESALTALQQFLDLDQPLSAEYPTTTRTGEFRYGDLSQSIKSGKIQRRSDTPTTEASSPGVLEAKKIYAQALETSRQYCKFVIIDNALREGFPRTNSAGKNPSHPLRQQHLP